MRLLVFIITVALAATASQAEDDLGWLTEQLEILADADQPAAEREAAERVLMESSDARLLRPLFHRLDALGNDWRMFTLVSLRYRVWNHFARHAQPEETRQRIFAELFDEVETEYQIRQLIAAAGSNHSEVLEKQLWLLFADREQPAAIRIASASALSQTTHRHSYTSFAHYSHRMIEYAWEERGSEVAMSFGARVSYHPLQNVLLLDWYERERDSVTRRSPLSMKDVVDRVDQSLKNITGLYEPRRGTNCDKTVAIARQRIALQQKARETGDDTMLREYEAEVAAQQQAELELRIDRIDAWVARNRDRLERKARRITASGCGKSGTMIDPGS